MAVGSNEYVIRIPLPKEEGGNSPVSKPSASSSSAQDKTYMAKSAESAKNAVKSIVTYGTAAAVADKLVSYEISTVSLRTGATEYEQKLQFGYSMAKQTLLPLAVGAATGGLPGAIIGGLWSFTMQGISWAQNAQTIDYNKTLENISIGFANTRAGVTGSRSNKQ